MAREGRVFRPVGSHARNTSIDTAATITPTGDAVGAEYIMIQALAQNVRFTLDGSVPTAAQGFRLAVGDRQVLPLVPNITQIKVISETAGAAVEYQYGKGY